MKCKFCGSYNIWIVAGYGKYKISCYSCGNEYLVDENDFDDMCKQTPIDTSNFQMVRTAYKKFLLVEDGSIDINDLKDIGDDIKVIIYRQGSQQPKFIDLGERE